MPSWNGAWLGRWTGNWNGPVSSVAPPSGVAHVFDRVRSGTRAAGARAAAAAVQQRTRTRLIALGLVARAATSDAATRAQVRSAAVAVAVFSTGVNAVTRARPQVRCGAARAQGAGASTRVRVGFRVAALRIAGSSAPVRLLLRVSASGAAVRTISVLARARLRTVDAAVRQMAGLGVARLRARLSSAIGHATTAAPGSRVVSTVRGSLRHGAATGGVTRQVTRSWANVARQRLMAVYEVARAVVRQQALRQALSGLRVALRPVNRLFGYRQSSAAPTARLRAAAAGSAASGRGASGASSAWWGQYGLSGSHRDGASVAAAAPRITGSAAHGLVARPVDLALPVAVESAVSGHSAAVAAADYSRLAAAGRGRSALSRSAPRKPGEPTLYLDDNERTMGYAPSEQAVHVDDVSRDLAVDDFIRVSEYDDAVR